MNKQSFYIITLFVICAISVTNVRGQIESNECLAYNQRGCQLNQDCCTGYCAHNCRFLSGICDISPRALEEVNHVVIENGTGTYGLCVYIHETNEMLKKYYYSKFNLHAANSKLPANSKFTVYANNTYVDVTISDDTSKTSTADGITFLSEEAAYALGITEDGTKIPCKIILNEGGGFISFLVNTYYFIALTTPIVGVIALAANTIINYY